MTKRRFVTKTYTKTDLVIIFGFTDYRAMSRIWQSVGLSVPLRKGKQTFNHIEFETIKKAFGLPERRS
jgi:hypothetical protein